MMRKIAKMKQLFARPEANTSLKFKKSESGQGLVELAFSLIIILILLAGIVDISRTIMTKMQLQDAAEEGVVYAMSFPKYCTQIQYRVLQNLSKVKNATLGSIVITYTNISTGVSVPCTSATGDLKGQLIKVSIANSFPVSMPFLGKVVGSTRTISVEAKGIVIKSN
jgi:Flp pilus assembly protein TadG